jgi:hypothetical protein
MPRRNPVIAAQLGGQADRSAAHSLSVDDLDELLSQAGVPQDKRASCADHINQLFDWYRLRLAVNTQSEASQAESLRRTAEAARELYKLLRELPPALRLKVEPDYRAFVAKGLARSFAEAVAYDVAAKDLAKRDPEANQVASMERISRAAVERQRRAPPPLPVRLPLEYILAALIETTEKRRLELEAQVSREWSKRRGTHARNQLALNLKAIIMGCSSKLANDERAAEDWAALALDTAGIRCPYRHTNPAAFKGMFAR